MKSKEKRGKSSRSLQRLSLSIGDFIRYWGFRRIHGAIWTQLYLSKIPLSCTTLARQLALSKALVSPALDELCQYNLIHEAPAPDDKTKVYEATENINEVIRHVLKIREAKMLRQITQDFSIFNEVAGGKGLFNQKRIDSLQEMILSANLMLEIMLAQRDLMSFPMAFET